MLGGLPGRGAMVRAGFCNVNGQCSYMSLSLYVLLGESPHSRSSLTTLPLLVFGVLCPLLHERTKSDQHKRLSLSADLAGFSQPDLVPGECEAIAVRQ